MAHSHACTGLAAGAATLPLAPVHGPVATAAWVAAWGGAALLPDFDQGGISWKRALPRPTGSTVAQMWGPLTTTAASLVGRLAGGHRWGTHDPLLAPVLFGALAWAAALHPVTSLAVLAFVTGAALRGCHFVIPGQVETTVLGNLALSFGLAWWVLDRHPAGVPWLPWAVAGGVLVHVVGDWLTVGGVPRPLAVPLALLGGRRRRTALGLFRTGARVEHAIAALAVALTAVLLARHLLLPLL
ncbi:metal-dependent hydrolase [Paenibacillus sp. TRM 82003]|uniref:metal-dependent hydrolase n=1 Tax=Kineococcus sp. TRM81007 TaxID=2925831 RepID=UPI001F58EC7A|nr:metal-dependent hydrolase [Kineococcus sp. TRM81007]MCI2237703.1 metal-dependent hydrolase [Kineococcus sp. TRM81007]MCI3921721.1 metal-dependent hydrolase [Paenibacillus sp. TRM 82003]